LIKSASNWGKRASKEDICATLIVRTSSLNPIDMTTLNVEDVDLSALTSALASTLGPAVDGPGIVGRTAMRDATAAELDCSQLEAEQVVDTLILQGFARLAKDEDGREVWRLRPE